MDNLFETALNFINEKGITAYEIATATTLTEPGVAKIISGASKRPHETSKEQILNYLRNKYGFGFSHVASVVNDDHIPYKSQHIASNKEMSIEEGLSLIKKGVHLTPFINADVTAGDVNLFDPSTFEIESYYYIPGTRAQYVLPVWGHSMYPEVNNGDRVGVLKLDDLSFFNYGMKYVVFTDEQRMVKYIKKHSDPGFVLLTSRNEFFDPIDMPISSITQLWLVTDVLKKETI